MRAGGARRLPFARTSHIKIIRRAHIAVAYLLGLIEPIEAQRLGPLSSVACGVLELDGHTEGFSRRREPAWIEVHGELVTGRGVKDVSDVRDALCRANLLGGPPHINRPQ